MRALLLSLLIASPVAATPLPLVCELTSEEVPSIKVRLTERTAYCLDGELFLKGKSQGTFQAGQSIHTMRFHLEIFDQTFISLNP